MKPLSHHLPSTPATQPFNFRASDVHCQRVGAAVDQLMMLTDSDVAVDALMGQISFGFEGFASDSHEVHQLPHCVKFFQAVHDQWPYWLHFMAHDTDAMAVLLLLLCDSDPVTTINGMGENIVKARLRDREQALEVLAHMVSALRALHENFTIPHEITQALVDSAYATANQVFNA